MTSQLERARQIYVLKRGVLGLYAFVHFAALLPYSPELFSNAGMLARTTDSPLMFLFPNVLWLSDEPHFVTALVACGGLFGLLLSLGALPRWTGGMAYYVWACLFTRNPLIANPSLPYVGLMLLVCAVVGDEDRRRAVVEFQRVTKLLWVAMAVGYSYSGLTKLTSPSWLDGSAVQAVLQSPLSRPHALCESIVHLEPLCLQVVSYLALGLELVFAPLSLWPKARPWLWLAMTGMHLSLVALVQFADLSIGMLVLHAFTFDQRWLEERTVRQARVDQRDCPRPCVRTSAG